MKKRAANIIIDILIREGIEYIFGVTGKAISPFVDAILDYEKIKYIPAKHESGAALMAYGYAQGSGKIGVCCATTGGGSTNLTTGVSTAYMNSVPLLVLTGQVSTFEFGKGAFQESTGIGRTINTVELFKPITKESFSISESSELTETIVKAISIALSGRMGPVHVNIPFDIQLDVIEATIPDRIPEIDDNCYSALEDKLNKTINLIQNAQNPVFLLGWGSVISGANEIVRRIAEKLKIHVSTTLQGRGAIPSNHPLCLGVIGVCGHPRASEYILEKADLLIAVGTSFGEFTTFSWDEAFSKIENIVHIDIDEREIGKNYDVTIGINGDAKLICNRMYQMIDKLNIDSVKPQSRFMEFIGSNGKYSNEHLMFDESVPIKPQRVMKELRYCTPENTVFLSDSGSNCVWGLHYIPIYPGGGYYPTHGLGSMGASICSSIGVKLSKPDNPVVCVCGDGSFLMYGNEVATAAQLDIPVIWVILNDSKYNLPAFSLQMMFDRTIGVDLLKVDFSKLAEIYNIKGFRVEKPDDLHEVFIKAVEINKPVIIDVVIDPEEIPPVGKRKLIKTEN